MRNPSHFPFVWQKPLRTTAAARDAGAALTLRSLRGLQGGNWAHGMSEEGRAASSEADAGMCGEAFA